jgi:ubiquinone/menaquinone biosynthesis C-methylase UbiE
MEHKSGGISRILESPAVFATWIDLLGAKKCNSYLISNYLDPQPGNVILDVGCGVGNMVDAVPTCARYVGIDFSGRYVEYARKHRGRRAEFLVGDVSSINQLGLSNVDAIILFGVLHHINDEQAKKLFQDFNRILRVGGKVLTLDPCFHPQNSRFVNLLIQNDRGQYVRDKNGYLALVGSFSGTVEPKIYHNLLRIPYTHIVLSACKVENA